MKKLLLPFFCTLLNCMLKAQSILMGMTSAGGSNNAGVIFRTTTSGNNYQVDYHLQRYDGDYPKASLLKASDGMLYGMTSACCVFDGKGVLFQYDPLTGSYSKKYDFNDLAYGSNPFGSLIEAGNGKLYGMTSRGGNYDKGVIFQYDMQTAVYTPLFDFNDSISGKSPQGSLLLANDGLLYGMTCRGGVYDLGVLFQFNTATNTFVKKHDFSGQTDGSAPLGSLIQATDGMLYGLTSGGGVHDDGVLFQFNPQTNSYTKKTDFENISIGRFPGGNLTEGTDGKLYGMTTYGGSQDMGVIFCYDPQNDVLVKMMELNATTDGANPRGSFLKTAGGDLYAMCYDGGDNNSGVIFRYNPQTNTYSKKFDFKNKPGTHPCGSLIQDNDGSFYGLAYSGGTNGVGTLFRFNMADSTYTKKFDFHASPNGTVPVGALVQVPDGTLYGLCKNGGNNEEGIIFKYNYLTQAYNKAFDFASVASGSSPAGTLVLLNGALYGLTTFGGQYNAGVLFKYEISGGNYIKLYEFDGSMNGANPNGGLTLAADGKLYGMTEGGGTANRGILFQFDPVVNVFTKKFDFDGAGYGGNPKGTLLNTGNGILYGTTYFGGENDFGTLFQFNPATSTYTKKVDFDGNTNGKYPGGGLAEGSDGKLYGLTWGGGQNGLPAGFGVLFQYNPQNATCTAKVHLDGTNKGAHPTSNLLSASDGNIYGMCSEGGLYDNGVLFQYDVQTQTYINKQDLNMTVGKTPVDIGLTEIGSVNDIAAFTEMIPDLVIYPNPVCDLLMIKKNKFLNGTLRVINASGQTIFTSSALNTSEMRLNVSDWAKGLYVVEFISGKSVFHKEIVRD